MANKPHYSKEPYFVSGGVGGSGKSLEFNWDGTRLGIRQEGEEEYEYVDLEGPKGVDGSDGEQGPQGDPGPAGGDGQDGTDGFPTESQWDDLVARVEALEDVE